MGLTGSLGTEDGGCNNKNKDQPWCWHPVHLAPWQTKVIVSPVGLFFYSDAQFLFFFFFSFFIIIIIFFLAAQGLWLWCSGFSGCRAWTLELRFSSCGPWA